MARAQRNPSGQRCELDDGYRCAPPSYDLPALETPMAKVASKSRSSCRPTKRRPSPSPPFHVKRRRGWIATSISWWSGRPRPISSRHRRFRISGRGTSPIRCSCCDLAPTAKIWVDLGSGGGFPGVVLACALAETPGANVHLVERNAKKAAFLREAVRITSAAATVHLAESGIVWIELADASIASLHGRWLHYISLSVSRNRL